MSEELKACPFCGSSDVDPEGWLRNDGKTGPCCMGCGATAASLAAWNRRAGERAEDVPLWISRALALVSMAVQSEEGAAAVRKQTGGNAPELVQGILDDIGVLRRERDALAARVEALEGLYEAVEKDECSVTYCAQQRGGMVHAAWLKARAALDPAQEDEA